MFFIAEFELSLRLSNNLKFSCSEALVINHVAGKKMKELWIVNYNCGEDLETRLRNFLVERKF